MGEVRFRVIIFVLLLSLCSSHMVAQKEDVQDRKRPKLKTNMFVKDLRVARPSFSTNADPTKRKPSTMRRPQGPRPDSIAAPVEVVKDTTITIDPNKTIINLDRSDLIRFDEEQLPDIQVLEGHVLLRHEGALLYCDSAYLNQLTNSFEAFGRIKMVQGDTLVITAGHLNYDGNTKVAFLYDNVKMKNRKTTLTTDTLTYERENSIGYYQCGGVLKDEKNTLISKHGYYHTDTKNAEFKYNVHGYNEDTNIDSDTLTYNTDTKIAGLEGPTVITNQDHTDPDSVVTVIYSDRGWYDTNRDFAELLNHSTIVHDEHNFLSGDTIYYDNMNGFGKVFHNMEMNDTSNKMIMAGHFGFYQEEGEIMLVTDSAELINYSQKDTVFAHADTLYSFAVDTNKIALAYHNGRIYSHEYQAISDSIIFNTIDSVTHLLQIPIVWNDKMQITGDTMRIFPKGESIDRMVAIGNAMVIQQEDSIHYDQISGKTITGYVVDEQLEHVEVDGNAESIFFPTDDGELIGLNSMQSSYMYAYFKDGDLERVKVMPSPTAIMYPMEHVTEAMLKLPNFTWQEEVRPKDRYDIFNKPKRATQEDLDALKREIREKEKAEKRKKRMENATNSDTEEE